MWTWWAREERDENDFSPTQIRNEKGRGKILDSPQDVKRLFFPSSL